MGDLTITKFDTLDNRHIANLYTITNARGASITLCDFGARIVSIRVPNTSGELDDVVLGFDSVCAYMNEGRYFGATIGRFANRISHGRFSISGQDCSLYINDGANTLHGGHFGFDTKLFAAKTDGDAVMFSYLSPAGEEGFPSNLSVAVRYSFDNDNALSIAYTAQSDGDTIFNPTNHAYFNLDGHTAVNILSQKLTINAQSYTQLSAGLIPTGNVLSVENTPFDFRDYHSLGERINADDMMLNMGKGYDLNYVLSDKKRAAPCFAARAISDVSGRIMDVYTDMPGIQLYTGNHMCDIHGKSGAVYNKNGGFCLETQFFADSVNINGFSSPLLKAGEKFSSETRYVFSVR